MLEEMKRKIEYLLVVSEVEKYRGKEANFNQENTSEQQQSKTTGIKKWDCLFLLKGNELSNEEGRMIFTVCDIHNQLASKQIEGHSFAGRLSEEEERLVADMSKSLVRPRDILHTLKQKINSMSVQ